MSDMVEITKERYEELLRAEDELIALENFGVDNWGYYGDAMASLKEEED